MWADGITFAAWGIADTSSNERLKLAAERVADISFIAEGVLCAMSAIGYIEQATMEILQKSLLLYSV